MQNKKKLDVEFSEIITTISELRVLMGEELFAITENALSENTDNILRITKVAEKMSKLNSDITVLLLESKTGEYEIPEISILQRISRVANQIADLQFSISQIKKKRLEWNNIINDISSMGVDFGNKLINMQEFTKEIVHDFKARGFQVPSSDLSSLFIP